MKLEVFYDYTCPYCYKGLNELKAIKEKYPNLEFDFTPCEAHPRPEPARVHSDLAEQVTYYLKERDLDVEKYNDLVYEAHFENKLRIDDIDLLVGFAVSVGADEKDVRKALENNEYAKFVTDSNNLVWFKLEAPAVPSYRYGEKTAFSGGGKLVDLESVEKLIN